MQVILFLPYDFVEPCALSAFVATDGIATKADDTTKYLCQFVFSNMTVGLITTGREQLA